MLTGFAAASLMVYARVGVLRTLLTRGLVQEAGVDDSTQGTLFCTTELFLERLGLSSLEELPALAPLLPDVDAIDEL